jgi:hypothetical protein
MRNNLYLYSYYFTLLVFYLGILIGMWLIIVYHLADYIYIYIETLDLPNKSELIQYFCQFFYFTIITDIPVPLDISSQDLSINSMIHHNITHPQPSRASSFLESKYVQGKLISRPGFPDQIKVGHSRRLVANLLGNDFSFFVIPRDGFAIYCLKTDAYREMLELAHEREEILFDLSVHPDYEGTSVQRLERIVSRATWRVSNCIHYTITTELFRCPVEGTPPHNL